MSSGPIGPERRCLLQLCLGALRCWTLGLESEWEDSFSFHFNNAALLRVLVLENLGEETSMRTSRLAVKVPIIGKKGEARRGREAPEKDRDPVQNSLKYVSTKK